MGGYNMVNIMVNTYDFDDAEHYETLKKVLKPGMRVTVIPFAHELRVFTQERAFDELYHPEWGRDFKTLSRVFLSYGIEKKDICILNPHRDLVKFMKHKIEKADVILFTSGNFVECGNYLKAMHLFDTVKEFDGVTIIASYNKFDIFLK
jgi:hypothetical protein